MLFRSADMLLTVEGRRYLRLIHQAPTHPAYFAKIGLGAVPQVARLAPLLGPALDRLEPQRRIQRVHALIVCSVSLLATQARLIDTPEPPRPVLAHDEYLDDLLDILVGMFTA